MAQGKKVCKICGKEYPYCFTVRRGDIFRWQDVACCPEHGSEYFAKILASREPDLPIVFQPYDDAEIDEPVYADEELFEENYDEEDEEEE